MNSADVNARVQYGLRGNGEKGYERKDEQKAFKNARILLRRGKVNINERTCHNSVTALAIAETHRNFFAMVSILLDYGADPNMDCDSWSTLSSAVTHKNLPMFFLLLKRGADPNFFLSDIIPVRWWVARGRDEMSLR